MFFYVCVCVRALVCTCVFYWGFSRVKVRFVETGRWVRLECTMWNKESIKSLKEKENYSSCDGVSYELTTEVELICGLILQLPDEKIPRFLQLLNTCYMYPWLRSENSGLEEQKSFSRQRLDMFLSFSHASSFVYMSAIGKEVHCL